MSMKIQKPAIAVDPKLRWLYIALGAATLVGFSWAFIYFLRAYLAYPEAPRPLTVKEAIAKEDPGRGAWVKLTDLRLPCSIAAVTPERGRNSYRIGTGASGSERIVVVSKHPLPCSDEPTLQIGVLGSSAPGRIVGVDFPGIPWEAWPSSYQITLWTSDGPDNARIGLWLCPLLALTGLAIVVFYLRAPTQLPQPAAAAIDLPAEQAEECGRPWLASDTVLPRRPLALAWRAVLALWFAIAGTAVVVVAFVVLSAWAIGPSVREALDERAIWASGVAIPDFDVEIEEQTQRDIIRHLRIIVRFTYEGTPHNATLTSSSLLTSPRLDVPLEIRIDARNPERVASSWTQAMHLGRLLVWAMYAVPGIFGLCLIFEGRKALRQLRAARAASLHRVEVLVPILRCEPIMQHGVDTGVRKYTYAHPVTGAQLDFAARKRRPLVLGSRLFAVHAEGEPSVLTIVYEGFYPFELSESEQREAANSLLRFGA
jgi:hypothetical protein